MGQGATIARVQPSGVAGHCWSTNNHGNRSTESMMATAISEGCVKVPGTYIVCWLNNSGMPFGRIYTVVKSGDKLKVEGGFAQSVRVNRWPPK